MSNTMKLFIGRAGKEPSLKYTPKGKPVCNLSVAIIGNDEGDTVWKKVVVWGEQAELCPLYLKKGQKVFVQGVEQKREFKTEQGDIKKYTEVIAENIGFLNI